MAMLEPYKGRYGGITLAEAARRTGRSKSHIQRVLRGERAGSAALRRALREIGMHYADGREGA